MKMTMKASRLMFGLMAAVCAVGMVLPPCVSAEVSDADFNALKETVQKLSEQMPVSYTHLDVYKRQILGWWCKAADENQVRWRARGCTMQWRGNMAA